MSCDKYQKKIALMVGNDLREKEVFTVRRHLEQCPSCRHLATELEESQQAIRSLADENPYGEETFQLLQENVLQKLAIGSLPRHPPLFDWRFLWLRPWATASMVLFLVSFLLWYQVDGSKYGKQQDGKQGRALSSLPSQEETGGTPEPNPNPPEALKTFPPPASPTILADSRTVERTKAPAMRHDGSAQDSTLPPPPLNVEALRMLWLQMAQNAERFHANQNTGQAGRSVAQHPTVEKLRSDDRGIVIYWFKDEIKGE